MEVEKEMKFGTKVA